MAFSDFLDDEEQNRINGLKSNQPRNTLGQPIQSATDNMVDPLTGNVIYQQPQAPEDNGYMSNIMKGAKSNAAGVLGGQADFVSGTLGTDGATGDYFQDIARNNARTTDYDYKKILANPMQYALDPSGLAYDLGGGLGSSGVMALEGAAIMAALPASVSTGLIGGMATMATRAGLPWLGRALNTPAGKMLIGNVLKTPVEAASEGGNVYREMTHDEYGNPIPEADREAARKAMYTDAALNMAVLTFTNSLESMGLGKLIEGSGGKNKVMQLIKAGAWDFLQNGYEEGAQQGASMYSQNKGTARQILDPTVWNDEQKTEALIGGVTGFGQGAVASGAGMAANRFLGDNSQQAQQQQTNSPVEQNDDEERPQATGNLVDKVRSLQGQISYYADDGTNCMRTMGIALAGTPYEGQINVDQAMATAEANGQLMDPENYVPQAGDLAVVEDGNHVVMVTENGGTIQNGASQNGVYERNMTPAEMFGKVKYYIRTSDYNGQATQQTYQDNATDDYLNMLQEGDDSVAQSMVAQTPEGQDINELLQSGGYEVARDEKGQTVYRPSDTTTSQAIAQAEELQQQISDGEANVTELQNQLKASKSIKQKGVINKAIKAEQKRIASLKGKLAEVKQLADAVKPASVQRQQAGGQAGRRTNLTPNNTYNRPATEQQQPMPNFTDRYREMVPQMTDSDLMGFARTISQYPANHPAKQLVRDELAKRGLSNRVDQFFNNRGQTDALVPLRENPIARIANMTTTEEEREQPRLAGTNRGENLLGAGGRMTTRESTIPSAERGLARTNDAVGGQRVRGNARLGGAQAIESREEKYAGGNIASNIVERVRQKRANGENSSTRQNDHGMQIEGSYNGTTDAEIVEERNTRNITGGQSRQLTEGKKNEEHKTQGNQNQNAEPQRSQSNEGQSREGEEAEANQVEKASATKAPVIDGVEGVQSGKEDTPRYTYKFPDMEAVVYQDFEDDYIAKVRWNGDYYYCSARPIGDVAKFVSGLREYIGAVPSIIAKEKMGEVKKDIANLRDKVPSKEMAIKRYGDEQKQKEDFKKYLDKEVEAIIADQYKSTASVEAFTDTANAKKNSLFKYSRTYLIPAKDSVAMAKKALKKIENARKGELFPMELGGAKKVAVKGNRKNKQMSYKFEEMGYTVTINNKGAENPVTVTEQERDRSGYPVGEANKVNFDKLEDALDYVRKQTSPLSEEELASVKKEMRQLQESADKVLPNTVELNAESFRDQTSQNYTREYLKKKGYSDEEIQRYLDYLDGIAEDVIEVARKYADADAWQRKKINDTEDVVHRYRRVDEKAKATGGLIPVRPIFKKNGEYPLNFDFGSLCVKREAMDAVMQILASGENGQLIQKVGPTQLEAIKSILRQEGYLVACDVCFVETKRARALNDANKWAFEWKSVLEAAGIKDDVPFGKRESLTTDQRRKLQEMAGQVADVDFKEAFDKYMPEDRRRAKAKGDKGADLDSGITSDKMKKIAGLILQDESMAGEFDPAMLLTTEGTDKLFRTYAHTNIANTIAGMFGSATAKPLEGFNIYDNLSWYKHFDSKYDMDNQADSDAIYAIGGTRGQSFTDFNPVLFFDYVQLFSDLEIRHLPIHMYTKVPSLIELFGESGAMMNMSLVPDIVKESGKEHAGLKLVDGKWEYAWANESFDVDKAMEFRRRDEYGGRVGTIAVGVSDAHIKMMLDDENIDMIIPFHKSGMPEAVQIKTGLDNATDYTDYQETKKVPSGVTEPSYDTLLRQTGDPRKAAQAYLDWCKEVGATPKFKQFSNHKNYYKLLENFRGYDNAGNPVMQGAVKVKLPSNYKEILDRALGERQGNRDKINELANRKSQVADGKTVMDRIKEAIKPQRLDGDARELVIGRLQGLLGKKNVVPLKKAEFLDALEKAYAEDFGEASAKEKVEIFRTGDGVVKGFAKDGKIYLNEDTMNANTPAHEFSHIWAKVAQHSNPELWKQGVELLKADAKEIWDSVANDPLYQNLKDDDAIASEVLARLCGGLNEDFVRGMIDPKYKMPKARGMKNALYRVFGNKKGNTEEAMRVTDRLLNWVLDMFSKVRSLFSKTDEPLTYDEFIRMPLKTMYDEGQQASFRRNLKQIVKEGSQGTEVNSAELNAEKSADSYISPSAEEKHRADAENLINQHNDVSISGAIPIKVTDTPEILKQWISAKEIEIAKGKLSLAMSPENPSQPHTHGIRESDIRKIVPALHRPLFVLASHNNSVVVFTDVKDYQDRSIIVPVEISPSGTVNSLAKSVYGRNNEDLYVVKNLIDGNLLFADSKKSPEWADAFRLQLPKSLLKQSFLLEQSVAQKYGVVNYNNSKYTEEPRNANGETKFSSRQEQAELRTREAVQTEIQKAFPNAKFTSDNGRVVAELPNGAKFAVGIKDHIILNAKDQKRADASHNTTNGTIQGYWKKLTGAGVDRLLNVSRDSEVGTAYHEAMHAAIDLALTEKEKASLYNYAEKKAKENGVDVEEQLADMYRDWVLARQKHQGTIFGKLWQKMKDLLTKVKAMLGNTKAQAEAIMQDVESGRVYERGILNINKSYKVHYDVADGATESVLKKAYDFIGDALSDKNNHDTHELWRVGRAESQSIRGAVGLNLQGYRHTIRADEARHAMKHQRADESHIPITEEDVKNMPQILAKPDYVMPGTISNSGQPTLRYCKKENDGTFTVVEVLYSRDKTLRFKTMWKDSANPTNSANSTPSQTSKNGVVASPSTVEDSLPPADGDVKASVKKEQPRTVSRQELHSLAEDIVPIKVEKNYRSDAYKMYNRKANVAFTHAQGVSSELNGIVAMFVDNNKGISKDLALQQELLDNAWSYQQDQKKAQKFAQADLDSQIKEGVAYFGRLYATDRAEAQSRFPKYYEAYEKALAKDKALQGKVDKYLDAADTFYQQSPEAKAKAGITQLDETPKTWREKATAVFNQVYTDWFDDKDVLLRAERKMELLSGEKINTDDSAYFQARVANSSAASRIEMAIKGALTKWGKAATKDSKERKAWYQALNEVYHGAWKHDVSYQDIVDKALEVDKDYLEKNEFKNAMQALGSYLLANRFTEIWETNPRYKASMSKATAAKVLANAPKAIKDAADLYYKFDENIVNVMHQEGMLSDKAYEGLKKYTRYCPLFRDFSDEAAFDKFMGNLSDRNSYINLNNGIKKLTEEGSDRTVLDDPVVSMVRMSTAILGKVERNKVAVKFVDLSNRSGVGQFVIPALNDKGEQLSSMDSQLSQFVVWENGEKKAYRTSPEIYEVLQGSNAHANAFAALYDNMFTHMAAKGLRRGATMSIGFMIRNFIKDTIGASINSKYHFIPFVSSFKGINKLMSDDEFRTKFFASGAGMAGYFRQDAQGVEGMLNEMAGNQWWQKASFAEKLKMMWDHYEAMGEFIENGARAEEFRMALEANKSLLEAAIDAKEVTLDFSRAGRKGREMNKNVPFFNAIMQGGDKMVRTAIAQPRKTAYYATSLALATMLLWAINHDDDWYKELDNESKYSNWHFHVGNKHLVVPKPQEFGLLTCASVEAVLEQMNGENPKAMSDWAKQFVVQMTPSFFPALYKPILECWANYDFYFNSPVVSKKYDRLKPEAQINSNTSELAKGLGSLTGNSPIKIDHLIRGYFGGAGAFVARIPNKILEDGGQPAKYWNEMPVIGEFIQNDFDHAKSINDWYDLKAQLDKEHATNGVKGKPARYIAGANKVSKDLSNIRKQIEKVKAGRMDSEQKRQTVDRLNARALRIAQIGLKTYSKYV